MLLVCCIIQNLCYSAEVSSSDKCSCDLFITVINVSAPIPRHIKETFWNDLQGCLLAVLGFDRLLMLEDF